MKDIKSNMKIKTLATALFIAITVFSCAPIPTATPTALSTIKFSGEGNAFLTVNKWRGPALIHIDYSGLDRFGAWNLNEKGSLLNFVLFSDGNYSGTQVLDFSDKESSQTYYLEISATGNWKIEILPFEYGRRVIVPSVFTGLNNDVVFLEGGKPSSLEISISESGDYFNLSAVGNDGFIPVVDGTPPFSGTAKIEQDIEMLIIEAPGSWEIKVLDTTK